MNNVIWKYGRKWRKKLLLTDPETSRICIQFGLKLKLQSYHLVKLLFGRCNRLAISVISTYHSSQTREETSPWGRYGN